MNPETATWKQRLSRRPNYKWIVTATLFFIGALNYADRNVITSMFPLLRSELGMSDVALGALGTLFLWSYALLSPVSGVVGDRLSRSFLILASLAGWSLVTLLSGAVASGEQLLGMRALLGVTEALYLPAALALLASYHGPGTRGKAMAIHSVALHIGQVVGGTLGGYLSEEYGWRACLYIMGAAGLVLTAVCSMFLVNPPQAAEPKAGPQVVASRTGAGTILQLLGNRSYVIILIQAMAAALGIWIFANWLPLYFHDTFKMSLTKSGFFGTILVRGGSIGGLLLGGYLSDRLARKGAQRRPLLQAFCYALCAPPLLAFAGTGGLEVVSGAIVVYALLLTTGQAGEMTFVTEIVRPHKWSTAVGIYNTCACLAGGAGILLAGMLKREFSLPTVFSSIAGIMIFASMLLFIGYAFFFRKDVERMARERSGETAGV